MPDLAGKVAIITGASSGIGKGTAVEFAQLGAHLALTGRNQENLQATAKACVEAGAPQDKILLLTGDICDEELQKNLVEQVRADRRAGMVNNAGIAHVATIETTDMAEYDKVMNVNVRSVVALTQLCVPHLAVTKELAPKQIRVNSVNPGVIPTEFAKRASPGMTDQEAAQLLEDYKSVHALGRNGDVSEVARTIAFLASSDASFTTGAQVPVDGGWHLKCPR